MGDESVIETTNDRASEGMDHLQVAAREMIDAARAFLDVAEEYIEDRDRLGRAAEVIGRVADAAGKTAQEAAGIVGDATKGNTARRDPTSAGTRDEESAGRVQHIRVE